MAEVPITINGRTYQVACDDGQEVHLQELAEYVDQRVGDLAANVGQVGDTRLLVLASLVIADELAEAISDLDGRKGTTMGKLAEAEEDLAAGLEAMANRLETVAAALEGT